MRLAPALRATSVAALSAALAATLGLAPAAPAVGRPLPHAWFSLDSQLDGTVSATAVLDGRLYAGGWFTVAGGEPAEGVATFDGTTWSPMPSGPGFDVDTLATSGSNLFAGGDFYDFGDGDSSPGGVAVWDGSTWTDLTGNLAEGTTISSLVVARDDLYAFGFTYLDPAHPAERSCVAMIFDGTWESPAWTPIGNLTSSDCMVNAAVASRDDSAIYVVGDFSDIVTGPSSGIGVYGVARYDLGGSSWSGYDDGVDFGNGMGSPSAVVEGAADGDLVVAGTLSDGTTDSALATWSPDAGWTLVPGFEGDDGIVGTELTWDGPDLYVGGYFSGVDGTTLNGIARWDGTTFHPVGSGVRYADGAYAEADTIAMYDGDLIVSGDFERAGSVAAAGVAYYGPAVVPGAPRAVKAVAGASSAKVTWSAPLTDGGDAVTTYRVAAAPGGRTCTAAAPARTCTVTGLTPGTTYRFTVTATNAVGTGPASTVSAAVTIPRPATAAYRTITARVLFYAGDSRIGPKGSATLAALTARVPAGATITWVKVTGFVQGTASRFATDDSALALARAKAASAWLHRHEVGGAFTVGSGGVSGVTGLDRAAVVAIRYVVPAR